MNFSSAQVRRLRVLLYTQLLLKGPYLLLVGQILMRRADADAIGWFCEVPEIKSTSTISKEGASEGAD
jgi:hypothetical protein